MRRRFVSLRPATPRDERRSFTVGNSTWGVESGLGVGANDTSDSFSLLNSGVT